MATRRLDNGPQSVEPMTRALDHVSVLHREALRLYRPCSPEQYRLHTVHAKDLVVRGGKRAGKSVSGFAEFVSRITGIRIKGPQSPDHMEEIWQSALHGDFRRMRAYLCGIDNADIPARYPIPTPKMPRLYWLIGWDLKHIGQTMYRILFQPGLFQVIRDEEYGQWRAFIPAYTKDREREREAVAAEPLIPSRLVEEDSWVWDGTAGGKAGNTFRSVQLTCKAKVCTYPSSAKAPKQGDPVDGLLIDEDLQQPDHLKEFQDRLTDHHGWFEWTAFPQMKNFALLDLLDRAEDCEEEENPSIVAVQLRMRDNPFIPQEAKAQAHARMGDELEIARRDEGETSADDIVMYNFVPAVHGLMNPRTKYQPVERPTTPREVFEYVLHHEGAFPEDWTRYASIDPSTQRTAVLFGVVPPPEMYGVQMGCSWAVESEVIVRRYTAKMLAMAMKEVIGTRRYEAFIMDKRMGRQARVGNDMSVFDTYMEEFRAAGIESRLTRNGFIPGCDVPPTRWATIRRQLSGDMGWPTLYVNMPRCAQTVREFTTYRKRQTRVDGEHQIIDEPANPRKHDAMAALEYLATYLDVAFKARTAYVPATTYPAQASGAYRMFQELMKPKDNNPTPYVHWGPGHAA